MISNNCLTLLISTYVWYDAFHFAHIKICFFGYNFIAWFRPTCGKRYIETKIFFWHKSRQNLLLIWQQIFCIQVMALIIAEDTKMQPYLTMRNFFNVPLISMFLHKQKIVFRWFFKSFCVSLVQIIKYITQWWYSLMFIL